MNGTMKDCYALFVLVAVALFLVPSATTTIDEEEAFASLTTCGAETHPSDTTDDTSFEHDSYYTAYDDVSWAITHPTLRDPYHQQLYDNFMTACRRASPYCKSQESLRLYMNKYQPRSVYNYTETGIAKIQTPRVLWTILNQFYQRNKGQEVIEWDTKINPYHNLWDSPTEIIRLDNVTLGGGPSLHALISRAVRPVLEEWTGQRLAPVSVYGVRKYLEGAILTPHVDRMPLVTSCIINIDQDVDEPWPLEIYNHDGISENITMEPGDMVLYESHSIIHGRPFPLRGRFYSNVFLHFEPVGPLGDDNLNNKLGPNENGVPPYIIPGSMWEQQWKEDNPNGWELLTSCKKASATGDVRTLEMLSQVNPDALTQKDENGWAPIHTAVRYGQLNVLRFLLEHGASPNDKTGVPGGSKANERIPIELAVEMLGNDHKVTQYLWSVTKL